jgi:TPR repeat protein
MTALVALALAGAAPLDHARPEPADLGAAITVSARTYSPAELGMLRRGAELGDPRSAFELGVAYLYGTGVPQDFAISETWFRKAAANGSLPAQTYLAQGYAFGIGLRGSLRHDPVEGLAWMLVAGRTDRSPAVQGTILLMEAQLLPSQVEAARARAETLATQEAPVER